MRTVLGTVIALTVSAAATLAQPYYPPHQRGYEPQYPPPQPQPHLQQQRLMPVYRLFSGGSGDHVYVNNTDEVNFATGQGYTLESTPFYVEADWQPGFVPLYRYYTGHGHVYTTDGRFGGPGINREGVLGYVARRQVRGSVPLYDWYNAQADQHLYTLDPRGERAPGFQYVGTVGYVFPPQ